MTVYAVHPVHDDISPARAFGDIAYINQHYVHGDELLRSEDDFNLIPTSHNTNMRRMADSFSPGVDCLLIAGDHLQLLAVTALLAVRFGSFDVLRYDRKLGEYIPVRLHSGLVPSAVSMLGSGTHIGETEHGESRDENKILLQQLGRRLGATAEAPLARRDPTKRTP